MYSRTGQPKLKKFYRFKIGCDELIMIYKILGDQTDIELNEMGLSQKEILLHNETYNYLFKNVFNKWISTHF